MTKSVLGALLVGLSSPVIAQSPNDTILPTGKRVEFTVASGTWEIGYIIRRLPAAGVRCIAVYSPAWRGALMLAEVTRLRADEHPGLGRRIPVAPSDTVPLPSPRWRSVALDTLQAAEPRSCA